MASSATLLSAVRDIVRSSDLRESVKITASWQPRRSTRSSTAWIVLLAIPENLPHQALTDLARSPAGMLALYVYKLLSSIGPPLCRIAATLAREVLAADTLGH
jgi:hypothetical protein